MFRSLYLLRAFNGDPHPGNYLFHGDGHVTFLDFGLVKHFTPDEMSTFASMVKAAAVDNDDAEFRSILERAGMLQPGAPVATDDVGEYFQRFYEPVSVDREMTWSGEYASSIVRHTFDRTSPISQYATVPKAFVFIQRINLGLYALLGELRRDRQLPTHRRGAVAVLARPHRRHRSVRRRPPGSPPTRGSEPVASHAMRPTLLAIVVVLAACGGEAARRHRPRPPPRRPMRRSTTRRRRPRSPQRPSSPTSARTSPTPPTSPRATSPGAPTVRDPDSARQITSIRDGTGRNAQDGDTVIVDYIGIRAEDGSIFDDSYSRGSSASTSRSDVAA